MVNIHVRNRDHGFFTQQPLTVVKYEIEEGEMVIAWCNHAGATEEADTVEIPRIDEADIVYPVALMVCDRCSAWKRVGDNFWEDAPFEGISKEQII